MGERRAARYLLTGGAIGATAGVVAPTYFVDHGSPALGVAVIVGPLVAALVAGLRALAALHARGGAVAVVFVDVVAAAVCVVPGLWVLGPGAPAAVYVMIAAALLRRAGLRPRPVLVPAGVALALTLIPSSGLLAHIAEDGGFLLAAVVLNALAACVLAAGALRWATSPAEDSPLLRPST